MNLSIKNVPEELVRRLKARAKANHRSLQGEVMTTLENALDAAPKEKLTIAEVLARAQRFDRPRVDEAAAIVRADRDSH